MKRLAIIAVVVVTAGLLWIGGELHKQNCIQDQRTGCSMLPWIVGSYSTGWGSNSWGGGWR